MVKRKIIWDSQVKQMADITFGHSSKEAIGV